MVRLITSRCLMLIAILLAFLVTNVHTNAQELKQKPADKMSISDIMKECHKKPAQLLKKVATGQASSEEKQRLVDVYSQLKKLTPPKGETDSWNKKTELLVSAATAAAENKTDAQSMLTKASNCMACHDAHKE